MKAIRTISKGGKIYYSVADLCDALGYPVPSKFIMAVKMDIVKHREEYYLFLNVSAPELIDFDDTLGALLNVPKQPRPPRKGKKDGK